MLVFKEKHRVKQECDIKFVVGEYCDNEENLPSMSVNESGFNFLHYLKTTMI